MMLLRALSVCIALVAAGCVGDAPVEPAATNNSEAPPEAPATTLPFEQDPPIESVTTDVEYAGTTPMGACVFPAGVCEWPAGGTEDWHVLEVTGQPLRFIVVITYDQQAPGMSFYAALCKGEVESADCTEYVTGPSPLAIEFDMTDYDADMPVGLSLGSVSPPTAAGMAFSPVDFGVRGTLVSLQSTS